MFLMQGHSTRRVYRLYDLTNSQRIALGQGSCVSGKVSGADNLYPVTESIKRDTKHNRCSSVPAQADGAGGSLVM